MSSDERDQTSPQADRLSRKIDRLQTGQPSPVLDGDTEELAQLAQLLMEYLDPATPDPEFRAQLKRDLIDPGPRLVRLPRKPGPRRYPVPAFFGALTVVLVASAVTGWMAFAEYRGFNDQDRADNLARFASASPTAMATTGVLMTAMTPASTAPINTDEIAAGAPDAAAPDAVPFEALPTGTPDVVPADAGPPPTEARSAVVDLPPVDARHVELGALATVSASVADEIPDVRFSTVLDPSQIQLDTHATAYEFSAPYIAADLMLRGVSDFLGIEPQIEKRERGGKTIYSLTSPEGAVNFTWSPESGAFACMLPDPYSVAEIEDLSRAAIEWLNMFGYPVRGESVRPVIRTMEDGQTFIDVPLGDVPNPALGHPMSITLVVDREGRIVSASGYWLEVTREAQVTLITASHAWDIARAGGGYWPAGTGPAGPGEFAAHSFSVNYMLTSDGDSNQVLALQPVIAITGLFHPDDGSPSFETTVYVKGHLPQG